MSIFKDWPHRWFGFWAGEVPELQSFPSKQDFVDPVWDCPQKQDVLHYLRNSPLLLFTCSGAWRTDGVWLWWDGAAEEIEREHLRLPDAFLKHITERGFQPLLYLETSLQVLHETLDWPGGKTQFMILNIINTDEKNARRVRKFCATLNTGKLAAGPPPANLIEWLMDRVGVSMRG